jgi:hypothetical protein
MVMVGSVLWQGLAKKGYDACRLFSWDEHWHLEGTAVFAHVGLPCRLGYHITCDRQWQTLSANVDGWLGTTPVRVHLTTVPGGHWLLDGVDQPEVTDYTDVDLNFSPSTNLLPIRRLKLKVGQAAEVRAAWLKFPSFQLQPLVQQYRRLGGHLFRYESASGFTAELKVNDLGFILDYPGGWKAEVMYENTSRDQA